MKHYSIDAINREIMPSVVIGDDEAVVITPPRVVGFVAITTGIDQSYPSNNSNALFYYDVGGSSFATSIYDGSLFEFASSDTVLSGITGADGFITVSVINNGTLMLENRLGGSNEFQLTFL